MEGGREGRREGGRGSNMVHGSTIRVQILLRRFPCRHPISRVVIRNDVDLGEQRPNGQDGGM
jgi:hypothetical protein